VTVKDIGLSTVSDETVARIALRALVDAYAHHVDGADADAVAALFSDDGSFVAHFHTDAQGHAVVRRGRAEITAALRAGLAVYRRTTHVVGGQVVELDGARAHGETVCLAHHVYERAGVSRFLVMAVRYEDDYVCQSGTWRFASRQLRLDWRDDRVLDEPGGAAP
jgi:ketosteroid isomerase-like protein